MSCSILILGASGALGGAIAARLHGQGTNVLLHGRDGGRLAEIAARLGGPPVFNADLRDEAAVAAMFDRLESEYRLRGMVFSVAERPDRRLVARRPWTDFARQLESQVRALHLCVQRSIDGMLAEPGGFRLVVVGSAYAAEPPAKLGPYAVAKAALTAYAQTLSRELAPRGVRVHVVAPDLVPCGVSSELPEAHLEALRARTLEGAFTSAEDVAALVAFLLGPGGDALHGHVLPVARGRARE